ncbi:MAG: DUF5667 domain-containing protein [Anaerolineae bacterium]
MSNDPALALANCLAALERGEVSFADYVERQPEHRAVLADLVPLAQRLTAAPIVTPSLDFRVDARRRLITRLPEQRPHSRRFHWPQWSQSRGRIWLRGLVMLIVLVALSSSVLVASAQALPNDPLYPVKLAVEQFQIAVSPDRLARSELSLSFASERLAEVQRLIDRGRAAEAPQALTGFADQIESALMLAAELPDSAERQALLSRLYSSLDRSEAILKATEPQLPPSAQPALQRAHEALRQPPVETPPVEPPAPTLAPSATPAAMRTPIPTATVKPTHVRPPEATSTPHPSVLPTLPPTLIPTRWRTYVPTAWPTLPAGHWPTLLPTWLPTLLPTLRPPAWPTFPPPPTSATRPPQATPASWPTAWITPNSTSWPGSIYTPAPTRTPFRVH